MSKKSEQSVAIEQIDGMIRLIRGVRVMLDRDLARIYGVPTFRFNEAIKRNRHRFPPDFMFQLTRKEFDSLTSQIAISKPGRGAISTWSVPAMGIAPSAPRIPAICAPISTDTSTASGESCTVLP